MMKYLLLLLLIIVAFCSCTKLVSDSPEEEPQPQEIKIFADKHATNDAWLVKMNAAGDVL